MLKLKWEDGINSLVFIMKSPNTEKGYEDFKKYLISNNMKDEADALGYLIQEKFCDQSSDNNQE